VGFFDWTLNLFDTRHLNKNLLWCFRQIRNYSLQFYHYYSSISHTQHFTKHALSPLGLLSHTSPLVLASNSGRSPSLVPKLSLAHSHGDSQCAFHLELPLPTFWSFLQWLTVQSQSHVTTYNQSASPSWCQIFFCLAYIIPRQTQ
jgi:hypothetical protein